MFHKGHKLSTGRPLGSPNKRTLELQDIAERLDFNPIEMLILFAKGDWAALGYENECYFKETPVGEVKLNYVISPEMRLAALKEVSPYLYAKLKEQVEEEPRDVRGLSIEDKKIFLEKAREEIKKLEQEVDSESE